MKVKSRVILMTHQGDVLSPFQAVPMCRQPRIDVDVVTTEGLNDEDITDLALTPAEAATYEKFSVWDRREPDTTYWVAGMSKYDQRVTECSNHEAHALWKRRIQINGHPAPVFCTFLTAPSITCLHHTTDRPGTLGELYGMWPSSIEWRVAAFRQKSCWEWSVRDERPELEAQVRGWEQQVENLRAANGSQQQVDNLKRNIRAAKDKIETLPLADVQLCAVTEGRKMIRCTELTEFAVTVSPSEQLIGGLDAIYRFGSEGVTSTRGLCVWLALVPKERSLWHAPYVFYGPDGARQPHMRAMETSQELRTRADTEQAAEPWMGLFDHGIDVPHNSQTMWETVDPAMRWLNDIQRQ